MTHDLCANRGSDGGWSSFATIDLRYGVGPLRWDQAFELPFDVVLLCDELPAENV